jgi:hypothetical protein
MGMGAETPKIETEITACLSADVANSVRAGFASSIELAVEVIW